MYFQETFYFLQTKVFVASKKDGKDKSQKEV